MICKGQVWTAGWRWHRNFELLLPSLVLSFPIKISRCHGGKERLEKYSLGLRSQRVQEASRREWWLSELSWACQEPDGVAQRVHGRTHPSEHYPSSGGVRGWKGVFCAGRQRCFANVVWDFHCRWWGQHSAFSSITVLCTLPCKTPKFQLKAGRNLLSLPPPPLRSIDLFRAGKGTAFPLLLGGPGAGSRKLPLPGQIVKEGIRMRKNAIKGSARTKCSGPEAVQGSWVYLPWLWGVWVPHLGLGTPSSTCLQGPEHSPFLFFGEKSLVLIWREHHPRAPGTTHTPTGSITRHLLDADTRWVSAHPEMSLLCPQRGTRPSGRGFSIGGVTRRAGCVFRPCIVLPSSVSRQEYFVPSEASPTPQPWVFSLPNETWRQAGPLPVHGAIFSCRRTDCSAF